VGGHEAYSFIDGFSRYHQLRILEQDQAKTTFVTQWGSFAYTVISFGLKNAPMMFYGIVVAYFNDSMHRFLEV
jgi:hypothetical protein